MRLPLILVACLTASPVLASCPDTAQALAEAWSARATVSAPAVADDAEALCIQSALAGQIAPRIGWKVGLTSAAAQQQFGVDHPVAGRLLDGMILEDGATVPRAFGGRPIAEADLLVSVRDAAIMEATTPREVLAHLDSLIPFIELADLMVAPGEPLSADIITAINVGARAGVAGDPVPMEATDAWFDALGAMTVRIEDGQGAVKGEFPGAAILGHPLNAVLWLTERLRAIGESLAPGDVISLGSFGPPMPPADLDALAVQYLGLPGDGDVTVAVRFE